MRISDWSSDVCSSDLDIVMYIFDDDSAGREIVARLLAAAQRGVRIRAVIDSFGSSDTPDALFAPLRSAGGEILFFSRRWRSSYLIRNHQKLILIDERIAITGGFNISEQYLSPPRRDCWFDLGLISAGPSSEERRVGNECVRT